MSDREWDMIGDSPDDLRAEIERQDKVTDDLRWQLNTMRQVRAQIIGEIRTHEMRGPAVEKPGNWTWSIDIRADDYSWFGSINRHKGGPYLKSRDGAIRQATKVAESLGITLDDTEEA